MKYEVRFLDLKTAQTQADRERFISVHVEADIESQAIRRGWDELERQLGRTAFRSDFHMYAVVERP